MTYASLDRPAQFLRGVGPKRAGLLARLGLLTARDVLYHTPRRYEDATTVRTMGSIEAGEDVTVIGRVVSKGVLPTRKGLRIFQAVLRDRTGYAECSWPGQPFLDRSIHKGDLLLVAGPVRFFHGKQIQPREHTLLAREGEEADVAGGAVLPVYPTTEGLTHRQVRSILADNLDALLREADEEDPLDRAQRDRLGLPTLGRALELVHRPSTLAEAEEGRLRLAFDELFVLQLLHARARLRSALQRPGIAFERDDRLIRPFYRGLPFRLTGAQLRVLREIMEDMSAPKRMNRLLQGDVGAGKTIVALVAMLRAVENGWQAALMAPTELLVEQHQRTLASLLGHLPVRLRALTGRLAAAERRDVIGEIASGAAQIVVGTQALIQEAVRFSRLGLAVVDEQHRFGVRQRLALASLGPQADVLVMSATPIPRSLALTLYGDLDVSVIEERPPGRQPVRTWLAGEGRRERIWSFLREQIHQGRQAYIVYPLVEESETMDLRSATEAHEQLAGEVFPDLRLGLLHGQMHGEEKDRVMLSFAAGEIDVLVATTVIEVGIDVPNATVMVVEHAERFGLSQLHQLRGRVGRGAEESHCILISAAPEAIERLRIFRDTDDGFRIAEADLRIRGQGDLFGARQHGVPAFRFADLARDDHLLVLAREEARAIVQQDAELAGHARLRDLLLKRFGDRERLFEVG
jgi:ATP-dependent DNA helicase RecG